MRITWTGTRFEAISSYEERLVPKAAGFRWDPNAKKWYTQFEDCARKLADHADDSCRERLQGVARAKAETLAASRAEDAQIEIPAPAGREFMPFQRAGVKFCLSRPNTLLSDEQGLGKSIQVLGVINADPSIKKVLLVVPASLKLNWRNEAMRWLARPFSIGIARGNDLPLHMGFVIINYDICARHAKALRSIAWDLLVVDENHFLKGKSQRTTAVLGKWDRDPAKATSRIPSRKFIALSGTPIPNRPCEIWNIVHALAPDVFKSRSYFSKRYCNGHQGRFGWDESGATNLGELQESLRSNVMIRRLKKDVLKELPAKRHQLIEVSPNGAQKAVQAELDAVEGQGEECERLEAEALALQDGEQPDAYKAAVEKLKDAQRVMFESMSRVRRETAEAMIPYAIEHLESCLEDGKTKVVAFAHHKTVIEAIRSHFAESAGAVVLVGETPMEQRQANVDRFQTDPTCRLFLGSITAAGVGITLTASSHVLMIELSWVPGEVAQAIDRVHRIGQSEMVLAQYLVFDGSIGARMAKRIIEKQENIDQALDRVDALPILPELPAPKAEKDATIMDPAVLAKLLPGGYCLETLEGAKNTLGFWVVTQSSRGYWFLGQRLGPYVERVGYVRPDGSIAGKAGIVASILGRIAADPKTAALRYGRELGICSRCGAPLTNDKSREAGIGPICAAKAGW